MINLNNDYIFTVDMTIEYKEKTINAKRIFHFQKKTTERWMLILLKIDESEISEKYPNISMDNILKENFFINQTNEYIRSFFGFNCLIPAISLEYWKNHEEIDNDKPKLSVIQNFDKSKLSSLPYSVNVMRTPEEEKIRNERILEEQMFRFLDQYLRNNEDKFFND